MTDLSAEILKAIDIKQAKGEERQQFLTRCARVMAGLDDDAFAALSDDVREWYDKAASAMHSKQVLADFDDTVTATGETGSPKRSRSAPKKEADDGDKIDEDKLMEDADDKADGEGRKRGADTKVGTKGGDKKAPAAKKAAKKADVKAKAEPKAAAKKAAKPKAVAKEKAVKPKAEPKAAAKKAAKPKSDAKAKDAPKKTGGAAIGSGVQALARTIVAKAPDLSLEQVIEQIKKAGFNPAPLTVRDARAWMLRDMACLRELGMLKELRG